MAAEALNYAALIRAADCPVAWCVRPGPHLVGPRECMTLGMVLYRYQMPARGPVGANQNGEGE